MPTVATVNPANAYRQIITNFSNPLEFVREAISNSIDASATKISVAIDQASGPTGQPEIGLPLAATAMEWTNARLNDSLICEIPKNSTSRTTMMKMEKA